MSGKQILVTGGSGSILFIGLANSTATVNGAAGQIGRAHV